MCRRVRWKSKLICVYVHAAVTAILLKYTKLKAFVFTAVITAIKHLLLLLRDLSNRIREIH